MEARILSYRRGRHTEYTDQFIVSIGGVSTKEEAKRHIGKTIYWETPAKHRIKGKITQVHGSAGMMVARFDKGLPGQALGTNAIVE